MPTAPSPPTRPAPRAGVQRPAPRFPSLGQGPFAFRLFADQSQATLTVVEQIAASVGDRILDGRLPAGTKLSEQQLADEFSVSRGPVREALRILEREHLATLNPRRGVVVTSLSATEIREIFEIRSGLYEVVARRFVPMHDAEAIAEFRASLATLEKLARLQDDHGVFAETVYRLTLIAAQVAGNQRLYRMMCALSLQTLRYSKLGLASKARRQQSVVLWREAVAALEQGDVERYLALARQRLRESGEEAARLLDGGPA